VKYTKGCSEPMNKVSNHVEKKNELPNLPSEEKIVD
jgi:hypothetical protein